MSLESEHDHHGLRVDLPIHRETAPRLLVLIAGLLWIWAVPATFWGHIVATALLMVLAYLTPDRRRATLELGHDTLGIDTVRMGRPERRVWSWPDVAIRVDREDRHLVVVTPEHPHRFAWAGTTDDLETLHATLVEAQERYQPPEAPPPQPSELAVLRGEGAHA